MINHFTRKVSLSSLNTPARVSNPGRGKTLSRKILLSLVFCFALMSARAQYVTIPDTNFVNWLNAHVYAGCMNGNQMDTTCNAVVNATYLDCGNSNIHDLTGISYFDNLNELICASNQLSFLPTLPPKLRFFRGWSNQLTSLPSLPDSIYYFDCTWNQLTTLPFLPATLAYLNCGDNLLSMIPTLPGSIISLSCCHNQLSSLPVLPNSLKEIECCYNQLTTLPILPDSLNSINCTSNQLTSLPSLPSTLVFLQCGSNNISSLPPLPLNMDKLFVFYNANLQCLPAINNINSFWWYGTGISCLPNSLTAGNAIPTISNVPLCAFSNPDSCSVYWNISGTTFIDANSNCLTDTNEVLLKNLKVKLFSGGILKQQAFSNDLGQYAFTADTGNYVYSIDTNLLPLNVLCPASFSFSTSLNNANPQNPNKDFSLECKPGFDIGVSSVLRKSGRFRPGNNATLNVLAGDISNHYNLHCAAGISGTVTVVINGPSNFSSVTPGALTPVVNGDTLIYSIADFGTVNFQNNFSFVVQTDTTAQAGDSICFDVSVTPLAGDNNTANNFYSHCFTVTNSFDPNEKEVSPSGSIDTSQHLLTYTIYFQNTGNDTALHVYLLDSLDNAIDESSIQLLAYSHEPLVQVMGNIIKFNFPNINLPDSTTDEPNSHGYVQYKVRIKDTAPVGTIIHNTAFIYFDFNAPVVTNTTFNQIDIFTDLTPTISKGEGVIADIYPNPIASGGELKFIFNASATKQASLNIFDMSGRKVFMQSIYSSAQTQSVRIPFLAMGIYQCVIDYGNGRSHHKLVIGDK